MKSSTTSSRLQSLMASRGLKQVDILRAALPYAEEAGLKMNRSDLSQYVSGKVEPGQDKLAVLAKALHVDPVWLMGIDVPMTPDASFSNPSIPDYPNIIPIAKRKVPLLSSLACGGEPLHASEDWFICTPADSSIPCDFALRFKGDSMIGARILDGDIVFIRHQSHVDDGSIAAVLIDDEATLKRVYKLSDGRIELRAENPKYAPILVGGEGNTRIYKILGKAVAFESAVL